MPDNMDSLNRQVGGTHYKQMKIQPIEFIQANNLGFEEGNAIKYICRHRNKGGIEDLEKAIHYIQMLIDKEKADALGQATTTFAARALGAAPACGGPPL